MSPYGTLALESSKSTTQLATEKVGDIIVCNELNKVISFIH